MWWMSNGGGENNFDVGIQIKEPFCGHIMGLRCAIVLSTLNDNFCFKCSCAFQK